MLQIRDIRKKYVTGDLVQTALDGVNLTLRDNEFVAILGPSGSGKTTLLNVIGGLDRYDSGDLIINGISTKKYSDRDWDSYRNHTIGFVFQSYNLIPHQTVLSNVELALTISGISRGERKKRAKKALEDVGLGNQLHKKPNQMSGGQMQRVAIARALVNDPDILLADEPTGALDSDTSVQVMELLKEVSKDRLVVMVTHNPELAQVYANRIVRFRDGKVIDDSNPYTVEQMPQEVHKKMGKARMSFWTALSLSFHNLCTKKARTFLTAFAGSIGIIGIALILSLSSGFQKYIDQIQEDTLSNYPLVLQSETADMSMAMLGMMGKEPEQLPPETVIEQQQLSQMFTQIGTNDLAAFKAYLENNQEQIRDAIQTVRYTYDVKPEIYLADTTQRIQKVNPSALAAQIMGNSAMSAYMDMDAFHEMIDNQAMLDAQYDVLRGRWPQTRDELVIVLPSPSRLPDYLAYTLGLKDSAELEAMIRQVMNGEEAMPVGKPMQWNYDQLMALEYRMIDPSAKYRYSAEYRVWEDMTGSEEYMRELIAQGEPLRVVGIVCPKDGASATALQAGVAYLPELTQFYIARAAQSPIVAWQLQNPAVDVFTGKEFGDAEGSAEELNFEDMIHVDEEMLSSAFGFAVDENAIGKMLEKYLTQISDSLLSDRAGAQKAFVDAYRELAVEMLTDFLERNGQSGEAILRVSEVASMVEAYMAGETAQARLNPLVKKYSITAETLTKVYRPLLAVMVSGYIVSEMPEPPQIPTAAQAPGEGTQPAAPEEPTLPGGDWTLPVEPEEICAPITQEKVEKLVEEFASGPVLTATAGAMSVNMTQGLLEYRIQEKLSDFGNQMMRYMGSSIQVDEEKIAAAFQFEMTQEELMRLMQSLSASTKERNAQTNLKSLGYVDLADPAAISVYLVDFAAKERFLAFLDGYNQEMEAAGKEEQVIHYTDLTGMMMSSVRTIVDSVSYVLIAFVAVSLIVSSIMIGIITYISVMERTKEIGVLRAIGASKHNISQVFNAETFMIGLCSGLLGVGITLALIFPINHVIHSLTGSTDINAQLPVKGAIILILLSMGLTLLGGLIPAKKAARKDPVIALRTE